MLMGNQKDNQPHFLQSLEPTNNEIGSFNNPIFLPLSAGVLTYDSIFYKMRIVKVYTLATL